MIVSCPPAPDVALGYKGADETADKTARVLWVLLLLSLLMAFYAGFRMPNLWSINYYIPSFFDGFIRRALPGTLLSGFGELRFTYHFLAAVQFLVALLLIVAIILHFSRSALPQRVLLLLFFLSPAGGYFFHEVGYVDQLLYLLLLVAAIVPGSLAALVLLSASFFAHEIALLTTVPLYLTLLLLRGESMKRILAHILVFLLLFAFIVLFAASAPPESLESMKGILREQAYSFRESYYTVFNPETVLSRKGLHFGHKHLKDVLLCVFLGGACAWASFGKGDRKRNYRWATACCAFMAVISPLLLGFIGWDAYRWIFLSFLSAMLLLFFLGTSLTIASSRFLVIFFIFLVFSIHGELRYFDGYHPRKFSASGVIQFVRHGFHQELHTVPRR